MTSASVRVLSGPRKLGIDLALLWRVFAAGVRRFGVLRFFRELGAYLRDNRNLLAGAADRYVARGAEVYAASALPAVNGDAFVRYLLEEVETFNGKRLSPLVFALVAASARCPYRCTYCYAIDDLRHEEQVPVEVLRRTLADLSKLGVPSVFLTGGEVMMRKEELPAILEPCVTAGTAVWLVSSGWGMTKEALVPLLPYNLRGVVISLDSRHEERAIAAKGHKDAFRNAVGAIQAARELGLFVSVDCVATSDLVEAKEFEAYVDFLAELGVHFVNFLPPHRTGNAKKNELAALSAEELKRLEALMRVNNRGRDHRRRPLAYSAVVWEHSRGCVAGQQFIYVNPLGEVRPCPFLTAPAGNIRDASILEIVGRLRGQGEQSGCFSMYEGLPHGTRISRLPVLPS